MSPSAGARPRRRSEIRALLTLATPAVITQVGHMLLGVVDLMMVGRVGVDSLAAVALGHIWIYGTLIPAAGIIFGLDPIVTQAHGARDGKRLGLALQRGIVVALLVSLPVCLLWLLTGPVLIALGQDPALSKAAHGYSVVQIAGVPTFLVFTALRQYLQGRTIVLPGMCVMLLANGVNVLANWILIYGNLGAPALGIEGAGIATAITRAFILVGLLAWIRLARLHEGAWSPWTKNAFRVRGLVSILRFGVPIGVQFGLELWAFQIATLFAGRLGEAHLAAHSVVLNLASLSFMLPLGISLGAATRVGNLIGRRDPEGAQHAAWTAIGLGAGVMAVCALVFVVARKLLPSLYSPDPEVLLLSAAILPIAGAFQLFDGIQVVGGAIMRGMGQTTPAAAFNLLGYYALALPIAWYFAFRLDGGLSGIWWGLCAGLGVIAGLLMVWIGVRGPRTAIPHEVG